MSLLTAKSEISLTKFCFSDRETNINQNAHQTSIKML